MSTCQQLLDGASAGVSPALRAVDCVAGEMTAAAFNRLFGVDGAMAPVLTILLTLYIAFFAFSLLTGRSRLGISALTPRMLTLGLVLTFATSWVAYQGVLWNLAVSGPDWIASALTGAKGSATQIFANRIDIVFNAIGQVSDAAREANAANAGQPDASGGAAGMFTPADVLWLGAILLLLGTVGILLTARIALAILLALGPVFVVMGLFEGTRGLTAGWLRGVVLTALTPLFVVLGGSVTLELLVPIISALAQGVEGISARGAMALFLVASVHVALMVMVFKVAATMVSGWQVFGLARERTATVMQNAGISAPAGLAVGTGVPDVPGQAAAMQPARRAPAIAVASSPQDVTGMPEQGAQSARPVDRRAVVTHVSGGGVAPAAPNRHDNRARGIGSRFRNASNDTNKLNSRENVR